MRNFGKIENTGTLPNRAAKKVAGYLGPAYVLIAVLTAVWLVYIGKLMADHYRQPAVFAGVVSLALIPFVLFLAGGISIAKKMKQAPFFGGIAGVAALGMGISVANGLNYPRGVLFSAPYFFLALLSFFAFSNFAVWRYYQSGEAAK